MSETRTALPQNGYQTVGNQGGELTFTQERTANPGDFIIPPPNVLWAWLSFVFERTGEWMLPPNHTSAETLIAKNPEKVANNHPTKTLRPETTQKHSTSGCAEIDIATHEKGNISYQMPLPAMIAYAPVAKPTLEKRTISPSDKKGIEPTNFIYVNSAYWQIAELLLEKYAARPVKAELIAGCKAVLGLIITWCNHPVFREMGNRNGQWMTLAFERCAKEIQMRAAGFKICLTELEEVGLIVVGKAASDIITTGELAQLRYDLSRLPTNCKFWTKRSIQSSTTIYRLKIALTQLQSTENFVLPIFNPQALPENIDETGKVWAGLENRKEKTRKELKPDFDNLVERERVGESVGQSFQVLPPHVNHVINDEDDDVSIVTNFSQKEFLGKRKCNTEPDNPPPAVLDKTFPPNRRMDNRTEKVLAVMTVEQQAKFHFLNSQADFVNFKGQGGRTTLDSREVLKFAVNDDLSLEQAKLRYRQVKEMWESGRCHTSPLGLLHWALTQDCDPRSTDEQTTHTLFLNQNKRNAAFKKQSNISSSSRDRQVLSEKQKIRPQDKYRSSVQAPRNFRVSANTGRKTTHSYSASRQQREKWLAILQEKQNVTATRTQNGTVTRSLSPAQIWQEVLEDLQGRWKLSENELALLDGSKLLLEESPATYQASGSPSFQAIIVLKSVLEERLLDLPTRNTIQLCLRQKLGSGYTYAFSL
jgi:hypothetical protein